MAPNLRSLGLAALTALALVAALAPAAQADPKGVFTTGIVGDNTSQAGIHTGSEVTGHQYGSASQNFFEFAPGSEERITCENATYAFTEDDEQLDGTARRLTAEMIFSHCTANGLPMTVDTNGCDITLEQPTRIASNEYTGTKILHCPEGNAIEFTVFLFGGVTSHSVDVCTIKVFPAEGATEQTLPGHVIYKNQVAKVTENEVKKHDVTLNSTTSGTSWEQEGSCGAESGNEAIHRGTFTVTAFDPLAQQHHDIWISDEA